MEKSKIILHEENHKEKDLEYFISELLLSARPRSGLSQFDLKSVAGLELNLGPGALLLSGREWLDPSWIHSQPRGLRASAPAWGRTPWCSALHTHTHTEPVSSSKPLPASQMKAGKEIKRFAPATQQVTGRAGKSSPTVTPVSPGETRPDSPVSLLGKGRWSLMQLISIGKWGYWVILGACRMLQLKPTGKL